MFQLWNCGKLWVKIITYNSYRPKLQWTYRHVRLSHVYHLDMEASKNKPNRHMRELRDIVLEQIVLIIFDLQL